MHKATRPARQALARHRRVKPTPQRRLHDARPPAPSAGALEATGRRRTPRAVATGNPDLVRGVPSTDGTWRHPRPRDNADAEALSASETPDALTVTERRGLNPGDGVGGTGSRTAPPGEGGGEGRGGSALARSPGPGEFPALDTSDARYVRWLGAQKRRIGRHLVFPRARRLALDQGTTVLEVRVRRDGTPARHPTLVRSSGFADFDDAARRAVERALPFTPLPPELAPEFQVLRVILPIQFENPVFR
ncbi:MAG: TonB family protein [Polyangiales bacterium]